MSEHDRLRGSGEYAHWQIDNFMATPTWTNVSSFSNSWVNYDTSAVARYSKDPWGFVRLEGRIKSGTVTSAAFTLPVGYRPTAQRGFAVDSNAAYGRVLIGTDGTVTPSVGSNVSFFLDGIVFYAG